MSAVAHLHALKNTAISQVRRYATAWTTNTGICFACRGDNILMRVSEGSPVKEHICYCCRRYNLPDNCLDADFIAEYPMLITRARDDSRAEFAKMLTTSQLIIFTDHIKYQENIGCRICGVHNTRNKYPYRVSRTNICNDVCEDCVTVARNLGRAMVLHMFLCKYAVIAMNQTYDVSLYLLQVIAAVL